MTTDERIRRLERAVAQIALKVGGRQVGSEADQLVREFESGQLDAEAKPEADE
jgi:hypothetical protein